ncbi:GDSL-type esterase/lipase family protein [Geodermatophilus nigrescens]|uniref:Lysophospholipase L1 n=1 Tax=Geodermatophilus nigrescens TaxID=1070870 RepID=A0A1M5S6K6_9ACTN|nr:GDSL-type esterase/lipase family protein [Geodermatophilus nigrescens]SHH34121.1 Lysophospholipase L1 [Geodermatophilus nigrescens]
MTRDLRLCLVGDSFTAGVGDETGAGWVGPVLAALRADGTDVTGYPLGIRRETSLDIARRWYPEVRARLRDGTDHRVVFSLGANDVSAPAGRRRVPQERTLEVVAGMLDEAHAAGWPAFVTGPPPGADAGWTDRALALSAAMAEVAASRAVPFADLAGPLAGDPAWAEAVRAGDGVHPDARGYRLLTDVVLPPLRAWLT